MVKINKIALFLIVWFSLSSCNESPQVDFHSYQELAEYDFIINGWFPEILGDDASGILETYDNFYLILEKKSNRIYYLR